MRPSFQMAAGTPCSAAYSSSISAWSVLPWRSAWVPDRSASCGDGGIAARGGGMVSGATGVSGTAASGVAPPRAGARLAPAEPGNGTETVAPSGVRVPSKLSTDGEKPKARPSKPMLTMTLDVRIARLLGRAARMGHGALPGRPHLLGVFPQITRRESGPARLPRFGARLELSLAELDVEGALHGIDGDDVAVAQQRDRPADGGFRADMADAEAAGRSGEAPVGDQRDLAAHALTVEGRGGRQHFSHPGATFRPLVADHEHVAFPVLLLLDSLEARFLPVKAACRAGKFQVRHPGNLNDRTLRREVATQPDDAAGGGQRLVGGMDHVLALVPLHLFEVLGDRTPSDGQALAMQIAMVEERPHQQRNASSLEHIFGDITATRFQIRDIWSLFKDFRDVEEIELQPAFVRDGRQVQRGIGRTAGRRHHGGRVLQRLAGDDIAG